jgi:hypothetical protein
MSKIGVVVRVDKQHASEFTTIVSRLQTAGLDNVEKRDRFLMVHGDVEAEKLPHLRQTDGVASVREEQSYKAL